MGLLFRCRGERALVERKRKERDEAAEHISLGYETKKTRIRVRVVAEGGWCDQSEDMDDSRAICC